MSAYEPPKRISGIAFLLRGAIKTEKDVQWCRDNLPKVADWLIHVENELKKAERERDEAQRWAVRYFDALTVLHPEKRIGVPPWATTPEGDDE